MTAMLGHRTAPRIVIEGPDEAVDRVVADLRADGWTVVHGWLGPLPRAARCVRTDSVRSQTDAESALLAALDGIGVVVAARGSRIIIDRLVDDLRRLGPVDHRVGGLEPVPSAPPEARAILGLLAEGHSLGEAAALLGLSRRTADRRVAAAREALGVERTTEAIARARRLGWLARTPSP
jgi:DNA-binding CsgD family transcriptional regulator